MLSRPNMVMNHGRPAAGRLLRPAVMGEKRSAARSTRLRRYVFLSGSQSHSRRGASRIQRSSPDARFSLRAAAGSAAAFRRAARSPPRCRSTTRPAARTRTLKVSPVRSNFDRAARRDHGRPRIRLALVPEHQAPALDLRQVLPLLLERVLDLEQIGEVARRLEPKRQVERLLVVVEDGDLLVEAVGDGARADDRLLRVLVDGPGSRDEEEPRLEVLEVVGREGAQPLAVDGQHPAREKARVEREQAGRVGRRGLDVPGRVADDERVAVEDLDLVAHRFPFGAEARGRPAGTGSRARARPRRRSSRAEPPPSRSRGR